MHCSRTCEPAAGVPPHTCLSLLFLSTETTLPSLPCSAVWPGRALAGIVGGSTPPWTWPSKPHKPVSKGDDGGTRGKGSGSQDTGNCPPARPGSRCPHLVYEQLPSAKAKHTCGSDGPAVPLLDTHSTKICTKDTKRQVTGCLERYC